MKDTGICSPVLLVKLLSLSHTRQAESNQEQQTFVNTSVFEGDSWIFSWINNNQWYDPLARGAFQRQTNRYHYWKYPETLNIFCIFSYNR